MRSKYILPLAITLLIVIAGGILFYIFSNKVEVDKEGGVTTKKDALVAQEVSYEKDGTIFKFVKNRVNRTAKIDMQFPISDTDEHTDFLGTKVALAPFMVNLMCGMLNQAFYDPEAFQEASKDSTQAAKITEDSEFKNALEGYKVDDFKIDFKDKETNEPIASCQSTQKGFGNIKFTAVRDYSEQASFLGQQIGVIPEDENTK